MVLSGNCPAFHMNLFENCRSVIMIKSRKPGCKSQHLKKWPGAVFSWFSLFGSWGLLSDGLSVSGLPCSDLLLFGQGTWESMALGFMMQFLIVFFSAFFSVALVKFIW